MTSATPPAKQNSKTKQTPHRPSIINEERLLGDALRQIPREYVEPSFDPLRWVIQHYRQRSQVNELRSSIQTAEEAIVSYIDQNMDALYGSTQADTEAMTRITQSQMLVKAVRKRLHLATIHIGSDKLQSTSEPHHDKEEEEAALARLRRRLTRAQLLSAFLEKLQNAVQARKDVRDAFEARQFIRAAHCVQLIAEMDILDIPALSDLVHFFDQIRAGVHLLYSAVLEEALFAGTGEITIKTTQLNAFCDSMGVPFRHIQGPWQALRRAEEYASTRMFDFQRELTAAAELIQLAASTSDTTVHGNRDDGGDACLGFPSDEDIQTCTGLSLRGKLILQCLVALHVSGHLESGLEHLRRAVRLQTNKATSLAVQRTVSGGEIPSLPSNVSPPVQLPKLAALDVSSWEYEVRMDQPVVTCIVTSVTRTLLDLSMASAFVTLVARLLTTPEAQYGFPWLMDYASLPGSPISGETKHERFSAPGSPTNRHSLTKILQKPLSVVTSPFIKNAHSLVKSPMKDSASFPDQHDSSTFPGSKPAGGYRGIHSTSESTNLLLAIWKAVQRNLCHVLDVLTLPSPVHASASPGVSSGESRRISLQWPQQAACRRWTSAVRLQAQPSVPSADEAIRELLHVKSGRSVSNTLSKLGLDLEDLENIFGLSNKNALGPKLTLDTLLTKRSSSQKVPLSCNMFTEYCKLSDSPNEGAQQQQQQQRAISTIGPCAGSANGFVQQALVMYDHRSAPTASGGSPGTSQPTTKPREFHSVQRIIHATLRSSPLHSLLAVPIAAYALHEMHHVGLISRLLLPFASTGAPQAALATNSFSSHAHSHSASSTVPTAPQFKGSVHSHATIASNPYTTALTSFESFSILSLFADDHPITTTDPNNNNSDTLATFLTTLIVDRCIPHYIQAGTEQLTHFMAASLLSTEDSTETTTVSSSSSSAPLSLMPLIDLNEGSTGFSSGKTGEVLALPRYCLVVSETLERCRAMTALIPSHKTPNPTTTARVEHPFYQQHHTKCKAALQSASASLAQGAVSYIRSQLTVATGESFGFAAAVDIVVASSQSASLSNNGKFYNEHLEALCGIVRERHTARMAIHSRATHYAPESEMGKMKTLTHPAILQNILAAVTGTQWLVQKLEEQIHIQSLPGHHMESFTSTREDKLLKSSIARLCRVEQQAGLLFLANTSALFVDSCEHIRDISYSTNTNNTSSSSPSKISADPNVFLKEILENWDVHRSLLLKHVRSSPQNRPAGLKEKSFDLQEAFHTVLPKCLADGILLELMHLRDRNVTPAGLQQLQNQISQLQAALCIGDVHREGIRNFELLKAVVSVLNVIVVYEGQYGVELGFTQLPAACAEIERHLAQFQNVEWHLAVTQRILHHFSVNPNLVQRPKRKRQGSRPTHILPSAIIASQLRMFDSVVDKQLAI